MSTPRTECAVTGCTQPPVGVPWSALCRLHGNRQNRTGSTRLGVTVRKGELKKYRERISFALDKYAHSKAVSAGIMLADDLLQWRPRADFTTHHRLAAQMLRLREGGTTARELLQKVCEVWALQKFEQRFDTERELQYALAHHVMMLRSMGRWRPSGPLLRLLGTELLESFGKFAAGVCWRIEQDAETRAGARKAFDSWAMRGEPDAV